MFDTAVDIALAALCAEPSASALVTRNLSREVHWLRVFATGSRGAIELVEALLDNEPWPEGEQIIADAGWDLVEPLWAARWFMVIAPR
jgi:hypothetical protein